MQSFTVPRGSVHANSFHCGKQLRSTVARTGKHFFTCPSPFGAQYVHLIRGLSIFSSTLYTKKAFHLAVITDWIEVARYDLMTDCSYSPRCENLYLT